MKMNDLQSISKTKYESWLFNFWEDIDIKNELLSIQNNEIEIYDRFCRDIECGTAGFRAIMGLGTSRINIYTISKVTYALGEVLKEKFLNPIVVIAYDTRKNSSIYAEMAAGVLASQNVSSYIFKHIQPTPLLSFAIRRMNCSAGIMITASHNSSEYNGFKVYGSDGSQMDDTSDIEKKIKNADIFYYKNILSFDEYLKSGLISYVPENIEDDYLNFILGLSSKKGLDINLSYSPLNGCSNKIVCKIFKEIRLNKFSIVDKQQFPDENFTTCPLPNPEESSSFELVLNLAKKNNSDLAILNDPDGDRVGVAVLHNNKYKILDGNSIAAVIFYYLLLINKNKNRKVLIKSIVSGGVIEDLANEYRVEIIETFTGFKHIGKEILNLEKKNRLGEFFFAYEESNGYLFDTNVRDKDGIASSLILCNAADYFKRQNMTLVDVLNKLSRKYGFHLNKKIDFTSRGNIPKNFMKDFKSKFMSKFKNVTGYYDYKNLVYFDGKKIKEINSKFKYDVLVFHLAENQKVIVRPSGTEPKIKFYVLTKSKNYVEAQKKCKKITDFIEDFSVF